MYASPFDAKHADGVSGQKVQFWSHLTIAPCSSHSSNDVCKKLQRLEFVGCSQ